MHYDSLHQGILELFALIGYFATIAFTQYRLKKKYPQYKEFFGGLALVILLAGLFWFVS